MALTAAKAFDEFASRIELTDAQKKMVSDRRDVTEKYLLESFGSASNMPLQSLTVIGSAQRGTMIRPPDDVDLLAVFDDSQVWDDSGWWSGDGYKHDSTKLLYRVRDALAGYSIEVVGSRGQAVRLFYNNGGHVDVVPAFKVDTGGYYIPAGNKRWAQTDPFEHQRYINARNKELGYHLKPLARKLKQWNRAHSQRLSSFHLEVMVAKMFTDLGSDSRHCSKVFFENAKGWLRVNDPAGYSGDLADKFTYAQEQAIYSSFDSAAERAQKAVAAENSGDHAEAIRLWRIVFGSTNFPAYG